ncbi:PQQ-dependent sugar dehydrogenase [Sphingomonas tabacisoli]|uniref:PQQ-dependent sugar dehydrogenase n=1 Tax=Sphingomonas tabacisoli TaxID=2249466 RepID=A0ABW4I1N7_9SPHN
MKAGQGALFAAGVAALIGLAAGPGRSQTFAATGKTAPQVVAETCSGCHGADLSGGRAPNLRSAAFLSGHSDDQLRTIVANGVPGTEMPAFKDMLSSEEIARLVAFMRTPAKAKFEAPPYVADPDGQVVHGRKQTFRVQVLARGFEVPWGLAFLPDGRLLITERRGALRIIDRQGHLLPDPVAGTPRPWVRQDAGMLDVAVHSGWVYLAYTEAAPGYSGPVTATESPPSMTVLIRGKLDAHNRWGQTQELFRAPTALYTPSGSHYGTRFLFDGRGHVFFSLGDRGDMRNAQRLDTPLGKIHRINEDGTVPRDNPFVGRPGAVPTIWSYGHRNPEGLAFDPRTGLLWESEHGPEGGDEINVIEKGHDYGWGVVSMGRQPGITLQSAPGMDPPIAYYTPAIAPSGIAFYTGTRFPGWKNSLFVAGLVGQQLRRLEVNGRQIVSQEVVFNQFGRVRAIAQGPDGLLYLLLQAPTGRGTGILVSDPSPGIVVRLLPVTNNGN